VQPSAVEEIRGQIERHSRFVLTSHARPDGDGVGSALAGQQILRALGKHAEVVLHDPVPRNYRKLPFADAIIHAGVVDGSYDVAILLECDSLQRTRLQGLEGKFLINIDHHIGGRPFAHLNWIDPQACATAELVYRLARECGAPITPEIATCLYTGLVADTGSFMFDGTNEHTFALARELVLAGAAPAPVAQNLYFSHSTAKNASARRSALQPPSRGRPSLGVGHAGPDGSRGRPRRRLRGLGQLRAGHSRRRSRGILSRTGRRSFSHQLAQQGAGRCNRSCRHIRRGVVTAAPAVAQPMVPWPTPLPT